MVCATTFIVSKNCNRCKQQILVHSKTMTCCICLGAYHISCIPIDKFDYIYMKQAEGTWYCSPCNSSIFPCNYLEDEDFIGALYDIFSDIPLQFKDIDNMIFNPLSLNTNCEIPLYDVDPAIQFYNEINNPSNNISKYFLEDAFNSEIEKY